MEFVRNKIDYKTILATLIVAFLVGRINLFNGTFPASVAFIVVMMGISTVYIYLVPFLIWAMASYGMENMYCMGDLWAIIICGSILLFFHRSKISPRQKALLGVSVIIICNCTYYMAVHAREMFSFLVLGKEIVSFLVYYECFHMISRIVFKRKKKIHEDKYALALIITGASLIGSAGISHIALSLWAIFVLGTCYTCGTTKGLVALFVCSAYAYLGGGYEEISLLMGFAAGLIIGRALSDIIDLRYERQITALSCAIGVIISESMYMYPILIGIAIFAAIPRNYIDLAIAYLKQYLWINEEGFMEEERRKILERLRAKEKTFKELGKLYTSAASNREIISYQFKGMARVTEEIINILQGDYQKGIDKKRLIPIPTGSASYSFEGVSGDSQRAFYYGDKLAMVISDGMGKGKAASAESSLVVNTLALLLDAGFDVDLAMKTVNGILMTKTDSDIFASVDLALINRATGRTKIFKMGAATTFVKHNGKVSLIKRPALPAGVDTGLNLQYQEVRLKRGDLLIMVSDGVCDCDRKDPACNWLVERIEEMGTKDPCTVAELIVNKAAEKYQLRERDDLTVLVAGI